MEHSQLPMNSSKLDQGQHSWKQVACKTLPDCQHHVRKHCPVHRSPPQAQLFWVGMMAMVLGQALQYTAPHLCAWVMWEGAMFHQKIWAGQTEDSSACSSLLFCPAILFFLDLSVHDCKSCPGLHTSCIPNLKQIRLMWSLTCQIPRYSSLSYTAPYALGSWSVWSVTHWAATGERDLSSRVGLCRCLWHRAFGRREQGKRGRKSKTSVMYLPSLMFSLWDLTLVASMTI